MNTAAIRLQQLLDQHQAEERDICDERAAACVGSEDADACLDLYFTELIRLAADGVDLVEAGYITPDFLPRIIEMGCQRWAQLEVDRMERTSIANR